MNARFTTLPARDGGYFSGKALFAVVAWGGSFVATRVALECFTPFGLVVSRLALGTGVLMAICLLRRSPLLPRAGDRGVCLFLGVVLGGHLLLQTFGLQRTTAIHTSWIIAFIPVTIAVGAWLFLRQGLRAVGWVGVVLATGGVMLVTVKEPPDFSRARIGDLLQLASCLTWTVYTLVAAGPVARNGALRITTPVLFVAAVVLVVPAASTGLVTAAGLSFKGMAVMAFLGLVCNGLAYYLWFRAVDEHGPTRSGSYIYLEPFVTIGVAFSVLGEPVTLQALAGGLCVLAGVYLVAKGSSRPRPKSGASSFARSD
jgi:drug/metabolite transporter (DMT)-like permease